MKKKRYYRKLLKGSNIREVNNMSIDDIYYLREYANKRKGMESGYKKFTIVMVCIYLLSAVLSLLDDIFGWDDNNIILAFMSISSILMVIIVLFRSNYIDNYSHLNLEMYIGWLHKDKKTELNDYTKRMERKNNIDSILNS